MGSAYTPQYRPPLERDVLECASEAQSEPGVSLSTDA